MAGVDQQHLHRSLGLTQRVEHRSPIHPGRFHGHVRDPFGDQPGHHLGQRLVVGVELAQLLSALPGPLARCPHRHRDDLLTDVDPRDSFINDLHRGSLPEPSLRGVDPRSPHEHQRV